MKLKQDDEPLDRKSSLQKSSQIIARDTSKEVPNPSRNYKWPLQAQRQ